MSSNVAGFIDELGAVAEQIKQLEARREELRANLKELGEGAHAGEDFIVTISTGERKTLDMDAVREKLSPQFIKAHTKVSTFPVFRFAKIAKVAA